MDPHTLLLRLGSELRAHRLSRGLTQVELAERAGIPRLKVVHVEAGRPTVSAEAYARVAGALGFELGPVPLRRPTLDEIGELLK